MSSSSLVKSFNCSTFIGNHQNLPTMLEEVIKGFSDVTFAINAGYFLLENNISSFTSIGEKLKININNIAKKANNKSIVLIDYNQELNKIIFKLEKVILFFFYKKNEILDETMNIFESFRSKLNQSINICFYAKSLEDTNSDLKNDKNRLELRIIETIKENIQKDKQIQEQHKMVQMGELIGDIAHQWREPLSVISTASSGMKVKKELNMLEDDEFYHYVNNISSNVQFLSKTIDEFRDYIQYSNKIKEIIIQDRVIMASFMVKQSFDLAGIEIIQESVEPKPILYNIILGELLQVLISIFSNSKEAFEGKDIKNKWVKYAVYNKNGNILITIEDNAGGIDENIISKVFNLDFTTKSKRNGTGIGLYATYNIVTNNLKGSCYIKNTQNGAKVFISFPLNSK